MARQRSRCSRSTTSTRKKTAGACHRRSPCVCERLLLEESVLPEYVLRCCKCHLTRCLLPTVTATRLQGVLQYSSTVVRYPGRSSSLQTAIVCASSNGLSEVNGRCFTVQLTGRLCRNGAMFNTFGLLWLRQVVHTSIAHSKACRHGYASERPARS